MHDEHVHVHVHAREFGVVWLYLQLRSCIVWRFRGRKVVSSTKVLLCNDRNVFWVYSSVIQTWDSLQDLSM
jgi:hypothetical protein